jgi:hypothetical protein
LEENRQRGRRRGEAVAKIIREYKQLMARYMTVWRGSASDNGPLRELVLQRLCDRTNLKVNVAFGAWKTVWISAMVREGIWDSKLRACESLIRKLALRQKTAIFRWRLHSTSNFHTTKIRNFLAATLVERLLGRMEAKFGTWKSVWLHSMREEAIFDAKLKFVYRMITNIIA